VIVEAALQIEVEDGVVIGDVNDLLEELLADVDYQILRLAVKGHTPGSRGRPPEKLQAAMSFVLSYLAAGSAPVGEVEAIGFTEGHLPKTLRRAARELGVVKTPPGGGPRVLWSLP
jgi:hypothetical protein